MTSNAWSIMFSSASHLVNAVVAMITIVSTGALTFHARRIKLSGGRILSRSISMIRVGWSSICLSLNF